MKSIYQKSIKHIPNVLTLLRVILVCIVNLYIIKYFGEIIIPVIITFIIFLTDYFDGKIARLFGIASNQGAVFDILADLFYMVVSYIVVIYFNIMPVWFIFLILFKFIEFVITSFLLKKLSFSRSILVFDFTGRIVAVIFYLIPIFVYISFVFYKDIYLIINLKLINIVISMALVSSAYRISNCISAYQNR